MERCSIRYMSDRPKTLVFSKHDRLLLLGGNFDQARALQGTWADQARPCTIYQVSGISEPQQTGVGQADLQISGGQRMFVFTSGRSPRLVTAMSMSHSI
jgi:hypothetical protein